MIKEALTAVLCAMDAETNTKTHWNEESEW
jgi:hypothetical protein